MTLNFPNRFIWLIIAALVLILFQSGCQPIQTPTATPAEEERANMSTYISTETQSPDGTWIATALFLIPHGSETFSQSLIVTHISGAPSYTLMDGDFPLGLGYTVTEPLTWSQDSARFYYTNRPQADGCALLFNGSDLHVLHLDSGETEEILPADTTTTFGLAPDEQQVAYLAMGEPTLLLHDLASSEVTTFDLTPLLEHAVDEASPQVGAFVWSPDSNAFAFVVAHGPCIDGWAQSTSIYVLDTQTMTATAHLSQDERVLSPVAWAADATLIVENKLPFDQIDKTSQFTLDLTTDIVELMPDQE